MIVWKKTSPDCWDQHSEGTPLTSVVFSIDGLGTLTATSECLVSGSRHPSE
jgi:hypothetical protein